LTEYFDLHNQRPFKTFFRRFGLKKYWTIKLSACTIFSSGLGRPFFPMAKASIRKQPGGGPGLDRNKLV
jgi:hypothetical protein